jgi:hypothetical protein
MARSLFALCCSVGLSTLAPGFIVGQQPTRVVQGSEPISSDVPALRISLDSSFRFAGTVPFRIGSIASGERFIFVDAEERVVRRLIVAQFETILPTSRERYNYSFDQARTMAGYRFRQNPFAFSQSEAIAANPEGEAALTATLLKERGYRVDDELMAIRYLTVPDTARRHELIVFYMEPLGTTPFKLSDLLHRQRRSDAGLAISGGFTGNPSADGLCDLAGITPLADKGPRFAPAPA